MQKLLNEKDSMLKNLSNEFNVSSSIRYSSELCHIDSFTTENLIYNICILVLDSYSYYLKFCIADQNFLNVGWKMSWSLTQRGCEIQMSDHPKLIEQVIKTLMFFFII